MLTIPETNPGRTIVLARNAGLNLLMVGPERMNEFSSSVHGQFSKDMRRRFGMDYPLEKITEFYREVYDHARFFAVEENGRIGITGVVCTIYDRGNMRLHRRYESMLKDDLIALIAEQNAERVLQGLDFSVDASRFSSLRNALLGTHMIWGRVIARLSHTSLSIALTEPAMSRKLKHLGVDMIPIGAPMAYPEIPGVVLEKNRISIEWEERQSA